METTTFRSAVQNTPVETRTENDMKTFESSLNNLVDLFFTIGASRGKDVTTRFAKAYAEDRVLAMRLAFWARDARQGAGERQIFRDIVNYLEQINPDEMDQIIALTPEYGRWDDLLVMKTQAASEKVAFRIKNALLNEQNGLCAKWMPRKGPDAVALRQLMGMTPKQYRKTLVTLTKVVETQMCAKDWTNINYSHVPSVAAARYQKTFAMHDAVGYTRYMEALKSGEAKINAAAVYPYDVLKPLKIGGDARPVNAQWEALPNYMNGTTILPIVDVSGSMNTIVGGNLSALDVSISLGLYLSDKNEGAFKNMFVTFSGDSRIEILKGTIAQQYSQLSQAHWEMNTNLNKAFERILNFGVKGKVPASEMPSMVLIISDMEFDRCATYDDSAMEMISRKYAEAGYEVPKIVFWNVAARGNNVPVKYNATGVALVSGFSPSIMKSVLAAKEFTPMSVMLETLNSDRYCNII